MLSGPSIKRLLFLLLITTQLTTSAPLESAGIEFIILHNNDMHARFQETGAYGEDCLPEDVASNKCYGGFARVAHEVRKFREKANHAGELPVIYLNAGDSYTGTPWFYVYKDNMITEFMNLLQPDAFSLGNHEFDEGIDGLVPFLISAKFPILIANLDLSKHPQMALSKNLKASTVLYVAGVRVGIIGYLLPDTVRLGLVKDLILTQEIEAINKEAENLEKRGVNIIIALGHSGYEKDQDIARNCPLVDIVIGGHSHSFLYTGSPPDNEKPIGPYPTVITQTSGKKVLVVQAYAFTKYLGKLQVKFDQEGNLLEWSGSPILLNGDIPQDSDVLKVLASYKPGVDAQMATIVGYTKVDLDGDAKKCREKECNLGNLLTDAFVYAYTQEYQQENNEFWSDTAIALIQGGDIRSSILKRDNGSITEQEVYNVLPYNNQLVQTRVTGRTIRNMLETSASRLGESYGAFLQMSGMHVVYDPKKAIMSRVKSVRVLCAECNIPEYTHLEDDKTYGVIMSNYLLSGGAVGYDIPHMGERVLRVKDIGAVELYLKARSPVYAGVEWRIEFAGDGVGHIFASSILICASVVMCLL